MPGIARVEGCYQPPAPAFDPFTLIAGVTAGVTSSTVAGVESNELSFDAGDLLIAIGCAGRNPSARSWVEPSPDWADPAESWTELFDLALATASTSNFVQLGCSIATAADARTGGTAGIGWDNSVFGPSAALLRCIGPSVVRQAASIGIDGAGTSIATTFADDVLATSQIVAVAAHRVGDAFGAPTDFSQLFTGSGTSASRMVGAARIGHAGKTVSWTGLSNTNAKLALAVELTRP